MEAASQENLMGVTKAEEYTRDRDRLAEIWLLRQYNESLIKQAEDSISKRRK